MPTGEMPRTIETKMPSEVLEMDSKLIEEARDLYGYNHEQVKRSMDGLGSVKAKKVLEELSICRKHVMEAVKNFRATKEKIYH
ncbi:MAG TPA: hypothetical protein VK254_00250 [Candidatus Bathyarchaeia archaeon]|nr:hypothetical protein [Candidatus Bathyarchaeia archaeon]